MMGCIERITETVLLFWCLWNFIGADNVCEQANQYMYCSCDFTEPDDKTETLSCFVFGDVTVDNPIWNDFSLKSNLRTLTFNSRTGSELSFVPTEMLQTLGKLTTITFRASKLGVLESYTFSKLANATSIHLAGNDITELEEKCFYRMHNLDKIELAENRIRIIPPNAFVDLPSLRSLYLDRNKIIKLEANAFKNLRNLNELDLQLNEIRKIGRGSFVGLGQLDRLDLFKNRIETLEAGVFSPLSKLRELDISDNSVSRIESAAFEGLNSLITLRLGKNRITRLPPGLFTELPQLMHADLSNNKIETLPGATIEEMKNRGEDQFVVRLEGNDLVCDCDLWWWTTEYLNTSASSEWKKQLRNIKCHYSEGDGSAYRISNLPAAEIGCSEVRITTVTSPGQSPTGFVVEKSPSSGSSSSQMDVSKLGDNSQDVQLEDSTHDSVDTSLKQDSHVTKGSVDIQQSSHTSNKNSAIYRYADVLTVIISGFLAFSYAISCE